MFDPQDWVNNWRGFCTSVVDIINLIRNLLIGSTSCATNSVSKVSQASVCCGEIKIDIIVLCQVIKVRKSKCEISFETKTEK